MLEKSKKSAADSLGADVSTMTAETLSKKISEQILLIFLRW